MTRSSLCDLILATEQATSRSAIARPCRFIENQQYRVSGPRFPLLRFRMSRMFSRSALLAAICSLAVVGQACAVGETQADLLRQAALGLRMSPNSNGVFVDAVTAGLTGAQLGVREGDVLVALNGAAANTPGQVVALVAGMKADEPIELRLRRASQTMTLRGRAVGKPLEAYPGARTDYGAVPFRDGRLRDILVTPQGDGEAPVVFLLPGFSCASIEPMDSVHPYRRLAAELSEAGVGFYRVEKPGVGDSTGGPRCAEIDFATELDAFRTAYKHLTDVRGVDPGRIFLFGHSLGGMQAPLLAAERPPPRRSRLRHRPAQLGRLSLQCRRVSGVLVVRRRSSRPEGRSRG